MNSHDYLRSTCNSVARKVYIINLISGRVFAAVALRSGDLFSMQCHAHIRTLILLQIKYFL